MPICPSEHACRPVAPDGLTEKPAGSVTALSLRCALASPASEFQWSVACATYWSTSAAPAPGAGAAEVDQYVAQATDHWNSDAGLASAHLKDSAVTLPAGFSVNPSGATGLQACSDGQIGITGREGERYTFNNGDPFNEDGGA